MPSAVLVNTLVWDSQRKAGFHWIAEALLEQGWNVLFVTVGLSHISRLRRDYRIPHVDKRERNQLFERSPGLSTFVHWTRWHPGSFRNAWLDRASASLFEHYGKQCPSQLRPKLADADVLIFDSGHALHFVEQFRLLNPDARLVYRMSDLVTALPIHPVTQKVESRLLGEFDLVSVPSASMYARFNHLNNIRFQMHGLDTAAFDRETSNPFPDDSRANAVFVGASYLDQDFILRASELRPEMWFHIIGPRLLSSGLASWENIVVHGEIEFARTVPYIRHADIGLHPVPPGADAESFSDALKVVQYSYCKLPVVAPRFLNSARPNVFAYEPGSSQSIDEAFHRAERSEPSESWSAGTRSWRDLSVELTDG